MKYELKQVIKEPPVTVSLTPKIIFVAFNPLTNQLCFLTETFQPTTNKKINVLCWYNYNKEQNVWTRGGTMPYNDNVRSSISFSPNGSHFLMLFNKDNFRPPFYVFDTNLKIVEPSDDNVFGGLCGAYFTEDGSIISAWNDKNKTAVIRIYSINDNKLVKSSEYPFGDEKIFGFPSYEENRRVTDKKLLGFFSSPDRKVVAVLRNEHSGMGYPDDPIHCIINLWNVKTPTSIRSFSIEDIKYEIKCFEFNPVNNEILAIGFKGYIGIYNTENLRKDRGRSIPSIKLYHTVDKTEDLIYSIAWSPDGNTIAFCNQKPCVCIYHLKGEYWLKDDIIEITSTIKQICFDITGRLIVATDTNILIGTNQEFTQPSPICDMIKDVYKKEDFEKIKVLCDIMLRDPLDVTLAALKKAQAEYKALDAKGGKRTRRYKKREKGYKQ